MFKLTSLVPNVAKGFQITLANGYSVSVQWGVGNYCDNYSLAGYDKQAPDSSTAETAIIKPDGSFLRYKEDDVQARQTPADVVETLNFAASL